MEIWKAAVDDVDEIVRFDKESLELHKKFDPVFHNISGSDWKKIRAEMAKAVKSKNEQVIVAEDNGKLVGFIKGYILKEGSKIFGILQDVYVSSGYRKKGLGSKFAFELFDWFKKNKCSRVQTEVFVKNKAAVKFYQSLGFKEQIYKMSLNMED